MNFIEVKTTFNNENEAKFLIDLLLDEKLIACGQILKIESHYIWQNKKQNSDEFLVIMKTKESLFDKLEKEIIKNHSYKVPEIVGTKICNISQSYADWITNNTK